MSRPELVKIDKRVHQVKTPGGEKTLCNRSIGNVLTWNPITESNVWMPRARQYGGEVTCWVCKRILQAARNKELDKLYGKGSKLDSKTPARRWRK